MPAIKHDLVIEQGTSVSYTFPPLLDDEGQPRDLSGKALRAQVRRDYRNPRTILDLTSASGRLTGDSDGVVTLTIEPALTTAIHFKVGEDQRIEAVYDLEAQADDVIERLFEGNFTLTREVTRTTPLEESPVLPSTNLARNLVFASPNNVSGSPSYRHLQNSDLDWIDQLQITSGDPVFILNNPSTAAEYTETITFTRGGNQVGSISTTPFTTAYNTSSDYRRKTNLEPITGALDRVMSIPVYRFNWVGNLEGSKVDGFIAHELAEVVPEAVTGEKDAVDENNQPLYQAVDQAKVVPLITAGLQELKTQVDDLEAGGGDKTHIFTQLTPSATWIVPHDLAKYPSVTVVDSAGTQVIGDVHYTSTNSLTIEFGGAFAGICYLN